MGMLIRASRSGNPLENPALSLNDPDTWDEVFGDSTGSISGVRMSPRAAMKISAVFCGVSKIANTVAKLPLFVIRRDGNGNEKGRDPSHPAYRLLRRNASPYHTAYKLKQTVTANAILQGNGYAYIFRDGAGRPIELLHLRPDRTYPVRQNGRLYYITSIGGDIEDTRSELRRLDAMDVLHISGLGYDGLQGYPLWELAAEDLSLATAQTRFAGKFFGNSATPKMVIEAPKTLSDKAYARLVDSWTKLQSGLENAHRTAILEEDAKAKAISINAQEAQLIESRKFDLTLIANWLLMPVHMVGGEGRTAFASLSEENQGFLDYTCDPWLCTWEGECWNKLLTEEEKAADSHDVIFERKALVRNNIGQRGAFYRMAVGAPFMTRNEARAREDQPPINGGDELLVPLNMTTQSAALNSGQTDPPSDPEATGEPARQLISDTLRRMAKRLAVAAGRGADPFSDESHLSVVRSALKPCAALLRANETNLLDYLISDTRSRMAGDADPEAVAAQVATDTLFVFTEEPS